jgi:hypothetical protein
MQIEELGKCRIEKDYQEQKFIEQEKENEKKVSEVSKLEEEFAILKC